MHTFFPELDALWVAENITHTQHNIYTLRGALIRDPLRWSKEISRSIYLFGEQTEVLFSSHGAPRWGKDRVIEVMKEQRDLYAHLNNQSLHLANQGVTVNEIHNAFYVPQDLQDAWHTRGYHGSYENNSRGVVNRFLGFWDGNPATLIPLDPGDSAPLFVEMMGGAGPILAKAVDLFDSGEYKLGIEILNKLVHAEPDNQAAKDALADHFEQVGYQQESNSIRNSFLAAAYELRNGIPTDVETAKSTGPDMMAAMSTELFLDFMGIRIDPRKVSGQEFIVNILHPDNGETFVLELSNAVLSAVAGFLSPSPDLTITLNRSDMISVMAGLETLEGLVVANRAAVQGDLSVLETLGASMVAFDPFFEMMPGTASDAGDAQDTGPAFDKVDEIVLEGE